MELFLKNTAPQLVQNAQKDWCKVCIRTLTDSMHILIPRSMSLPIHKARIIITARCHQRGKKINKYVPKLKTPHHLNIFCTC